MRLDKAEELFELGELASDKGADIVGPRERELIVHGDGDAMIDIVLGRGLIRPEEAPGDVWQRHPRQPLERSPPKLVLLFRIETG